MKASSNRITKSGNPPVDSEIAEWIGKDDEAKIYHDGKWVLLTIDTDKIVDDARRLIAVKRKPKKCNDGYHGT